MPTLQNPSPTQMPPAAALERQQRRRMLIALLVLLVALVLVLIKDRTLFPPSGPESETESTEPSSAAQVIQERAPVAVPAESSRPSRPKIRALRQPIKTAVFSDANNAGSSLILATARAIFPPLEVEVVAGNQHRSLDTSDNAVNVRLQDGLAPVPAGQTPTAGRAGADSVQRVQLSPGNAQVVDSSVEPSYPMLAKQMKVQGAVVLETLISKAGTIDDIQVLSGPAILSAAAREAVRQWRFKPYLKGGQPVDSQARVTVKFTISAD